MNEGQTPITTATARIVIEPDTSKYDEFKRTMETDIADLGEKFKTVFSVNLEGFGDQISEQVRRLEAAKIGDEGDKTTPSGDGIPGQAEQVLTKLTEIQESLVRMANAMEELTEALTSQQ